MTPRTGDVGVPEQVKKRDELVELAVNIADDVKGHESPRGLLHSGKNFSIVVCLPVGTPSVPAYTMRSGVPTGAASDYAFYRASTNITARDTVRHWRCANVPVESRGICGETMTLTIRKLGSQGLQVSAIGLGCMGMSQSYGPADETESIATLHRAIDVGCTFLDTAEVYGPFTNEDLLGRALGSKRAQVTLATKFGFHIKDGKITGTDSRPAHIRAVVHASLERLRTDHIDLLYQHRVDKNVPIEDVAATVAELVREGKVRYFGLSEAGVANIRRAHAVHPVSAVQSEYSLWERNLERDVIPALTELGIGLVPFSPLGRGFLTGEVKRAEEYPADDFRRNDPRYQGSNYDANVAAAQTVRDIAAAKHVKPGQIALAWLLHKGPSIVPIPGTKRRRYLEENVAAASISLTPTEMATLDDALAANKVAGPRYSETMMSLVDR